MNFNPPGDPFSGVARPFSYSHFDAYRKWAERGFCGDMGYLSRPEARASSIQALMPEARTIMAFGFPYPFDRRQALRAPDRSSFKIAQYAHGEDYHKRIRRHLRGAAKSLPGTFQLYCDSGQLMEKETARQAGLGFIGKHTLLIRPGHGSAMMLGFILTSAELDPASGEAFPGCGKCVRCLSVCPTGALVAPYTLDARRCISYLTMEARTSTEGPGTRWGYIYGCDLCQAVCPYNARNPASEAPDLPPDLERVSPDRLEQNREAVRRETPISSLDQDGLHIPMNPHLREELERLLDGARGAHGYDGRDFPGQPGDRKDALRRFFRKTQLVGMDRPFRFLLHPRNP